MTTTSEVINIINIIIQIKKIGFGTIRRSNNKNEGNKRRRF
jgi:hypothetical protein